MFGIQHSKGYFQHIMDRKIFIDGFEVRDFTWIDKPYYPFDTEDKANKVITLYSIRNAKIVEYVKMEVKIDTKVTRIDRNIDFLIETREKAKKFGMKSVGIKSIDRILNEDLSYVPKQLVKHNQETHRCRIDGGWFEVTFEHVKKGHIAIIGYKTANEANNKDRIAFIEKDNITGVYKLSLGIYGNTYSKDNYTVFGNIPTLVGGTGKVVNILKETLIDKEAIEVNKQEFIVDNPHLLFGGVDKVITHNTIEESKVIQRKPYSPICTKFCWINDKWHIIIFEMVTPGHVIVHGYKLSKYGAIVGDNIVKLIYHHRKGIYKLAITEWGSGIIDKNMTYTIDNPHEIFSIK
jgi:hypothetical protein